MSIRVNADAEQRFHRIITDESRDLHVVTSVSGVYQFVSQASLALFGWPADELIGRQQLTFAHPDDVDLVERGLHHTLEGTARRSAVVWRFRGADGTYHWTEWFSDAVDDAGETVIVSTVRDIGDRRRADSILERKATTDPLTGCANRWMLMDRLQQALRRLERHDGLVALLLLDLDHFKNINDTAGHRKGDEVLLLMVDRLRGLLRPHDTLARLGGDEFVIVVEDMTSAEDVIALGARIIEAGRVAFVVGDEQFNCTTSVGISMTPDFHHSAEALLQEADLAMYRAKGGGRDRADLFDEDLRSHAVRRLETERMLRKAIDEDRIRVEYQPVVDLGTGATVAAEALVRVCDSMHDLLIAAAAFIDVAEEVGILATIDDGVLRQAVGQLAVWRERLAGTAFAAVAINVSARYLADPDFVSGMIGALEDHDVPAGALQVEVTERVLMDASRSAMTSLTLLREAGVKVALDHFGTGFSSLSYLRLFPLDVVKIDQSFIHELRIGSTEHAIVASIIELGHALGMAVVAEGVESSSQFDQLVALGCDRAQGFFFAPAGPAGAIEDRVLRSGS